ncbi:MAG: OmpH family outer membrane protein [Deltaproteobacteria bacterium]|nr:OmpH family outer membrane protein [Deltaproteobacteria bacterium]
MRYLVVLSLLFSLVSSAELKIAVIELERALNETSDGQKAQKDLKKEFDKTQALLEKKQGELKKAHEKFQSKSAVMNEKARQEEGMKLQGQIAEFQQLSGESQQEFMAKQNETMKGLLDKMTPIVESVAKKEDYDLVLNKTEATVVYAKPGLNITDRVVKDYDKKTSKKK